MHLLYDGPSLLDGQPIVVLATGVETPSENRKTGPMIQTWILRKDTSPTYALKHDHDVSICGDCPHRKSSCYVNVGQAPQSVWNAYNKRRWHWNVDLLTPREIVALGTRREVRFGAYGDPAAAPFEIWESLSLNARLTTGYSHQWRTCDQRLRQLCMASVDTLHQMQEAQAMGWRTFRIGDDSEPRTTCEARCPASQEAGYKLQCINCGACDGTATGKNAGIFIHVHGANWKKERFTQTAARLRAEEELTRIPVTAVA